MNMIKPARIQKGDTVGVIAPASPPDQEKVKQALSFFTELGLHYKLGKNIECQYGYLAGSDEERVEDVHSMFLDPSVKAIFSARGGYGTPRIATQIDYEIVKNNPKIFWGYSDLTFLHNAFIQKAGLVTFHGPMLSSDLGGDSIDPLTKSRFMQLFDSQSFVYDETISPLVTEIPGEASGLLIGGNLSLLVSTLGTEFEIDTKDKLLFIEDIHEEPRSVDRMLNQLYMCGKLSDATGILVGNFKECEPSHSLSLTLAEVLQHYMKLANKPAVSGFQIGHCTPHVAIPLGTFSKLDASNRKVIIESGVK
ncbi:S66 peptidase family protein [Peribacillus huizhouensis]|uniref:Muramoyltetrapeptide carboxypeptidase n=1 Tax=Peribacillus huizhouensis TaxID=1501239 RepID=A0ABR6CL74_9BACI|nr:LD-carboxypeptidase [Peribacillus huizhouensis]MBA9025107.1 muramoyltetrapeptide carboxypeptidase [Peribacillus huizhouensis]